MSFRFLRIGFCVNRVAVIVNEVGLLIVFGIIDGRSAAAHQTAADTGELLGIVLIDVIRFVDECGNLRHLHFFVVDRIRTVRFLNSRSAAVAGHAASGRFVCRVGQRSVVENVGEVVLVRIGHLIVRQPVAVKHCLKTVDKRCNQQDRGKRKVDDAHMLFRFVLGIVLEVFQREESAFALDRAEEYICAHCEQQNRKQ